MAVATDAAQEFAYDVFISYSRKDLAFARRLQQELRSYRPPRDLPLPQRFLKVFRDEEDFTGPEYHQSLDRSLRGADKLIVVCSPNSAGSPFVADEIRRFAEYRGREHIVSVLIDGIPNDEATAATLERRAFPEALVALLPVPLAADYRGAADTRGRFAKSAFAPAWFKTLADVLAGYGVDRAAIEQRERRREMRRLRNLAAISSAVALALIALTVWALLSRNEAARQRDNAESRRYETEARLAFGASGDSLVRAAALAATSIRYTPTVDGHITLARFADLIPNGPSWRVALTEPVPFTSGGRRQSIALSSDGRRIATIGPTGPLRIVDALTGKVVNSFDVAPHPHDRTAIAFSPDGRVLAVGCIVRVCIVDAATGQTVQQLSDDDARSAAMFWSFSFSPDGKRMAAAAYGSPNVLVYEVGTWRPTGRLRASTDSVFAVAFSADGRWLASASPREVQLWRAGDEAEPAARVSVSDIVWSLAFANRSDHTVLVAAGRTLQSWIIAEAGDHTVALQPKADAPIQAHAILAASWRGRPCLAAAAQDAIHIVCGDALDEQLRAPVPSSGAAGVVDGSVFVNQEPDGTVSRWEIGGGSESHHLQTGAAVHSMMAARRGGWIAAGTEKGDVVVVDALSGAQRARLHLAADVTRLAASRDEDRLIAVANGAVHAFDTASWQELRVLNFDRGVTFAAYGAGGDLILLAGPALVVIDPNDWHERLRIVHDAAVTTVRLNAAGDRIATVTHIAGGHDQGVLLTRVFDIPGKTEVGWRYEAPGGSNISAAAMRDHAAARGKAIEGGDAAEVTRAAEWQAVAQEDLEESVSADGSLKVASSDSLATVTDVASDRAIASFDHASPVTAVRFVPESRPRRLVTAAEDGTITWWLIQPSELADAVCTRLHTILSPERWQALLGTAETVKACSDK